MNVPEQRVPFHQAYVGDEEANAVADVVRSGWLTTGPVAIDFEQRFAHYVGAKHAISVNSCTAALHLALEAAGVHAGDEVLVPANTFTATGEVVTYLGARPVLVDIDPETLNIDANDAATRVTSRTAAILPVHFAGQPCDMEAVHSLARSHDLTVIEDAAHALPASYHGKRIGSLSKFTAFSFYATKTLATGEGGMITTDDDACAERMRCMRLHGIGGDAWKRYRADGGWQYEVSEAGYKYNLTDMQAAIGNVQLAKCDRMNSMRARIASLYNSAFESDDALQIPVVRNDRETSWHLYVLRLHLDLLNIDRDAFIIELKRRGIGVSVHFIPLHLHPYYQRQHGYKPGDFPVAEQQFRRYLSLPIFPGMTDGQVEYVISSVRQIVRTASKRQLVSVA